jgi:hypothetical protein
MLKSFIQLTQFREKLIKHHEIIEIFVVVFLKKDEKEEKNF